jgi:hypothetical protein
MAGAGGHRAKFPDVLSGNLRAARRAGWVQDPAGRGGGFPMNRAAARPLSRRSALRYLAVVNSTSL